MINRIVKNAAAQMIGQIVSFVDRIVVVGILIRHWGPDLYSEWVVILSSVGLLSLGELGLNIYYGNVLQQAWAAKNSALFQRTVSIALTCSISVAAVLGLASGLIAWAANFPASSHLSNLSSADANAMLIMLGLATISRIARGSISQVFRGRQQFAFGSMVDLVCSITTVGATLTAALLGGDPVLVSALYLGCDLIFGWGVMLAALHFRCRDLRIVPEMPRQGELKNIIQNVRWLGVLQAAPVAWLQLPVIMLAQFGSGGAPLVGFVVLRTLVNFTRSIGSMLALGSAVELTEFYHSGNHRALTEQLHYAGQVISIIFVMLVSGVLVFGKSIVELWTGNHNYYDYSVVLFLTIGAVAAAPSTLLNSHFMFVNQMRPPAFAQILQLAAGLTLAICTIPYFGVIGAAVSICIGEVLGQALVLPALASRQIAGLQYRKYILICSTKMLAAAIWCGGIALSLKCIFEPRTLLGTALTSASWLVVSTPLVIWVALPEARRKALIQRLTGIVSNSG